MSTFCYGNLITEKAFDAIQMAKDLQQYALNSKCKFHMQFGGNAGAYCNFARRLPVRGLQFDITNSIIENTAEEVFQCTFGAPLSQNPFLENIANIQSLFEYAFSVFKVDCIFFAIENDHAPFSLEDCRPCHIRDLHDLLYAFCTQDPHFGNLYLMVTAAQ